MGEDQAGPEIGIRPIGTGISGSVYLKHCVEVEAQTIGRHITLIPISVRRRVMEEGKMGTSKI